MSKIFALYITVLWIHYISSDVYRELTIIKNEKRDAGIRSCFLDKFIYLNLGTCCKTQGDVRWQPDCWALSFVHIPHIHLCSSPSERWTNSFVPKLWVTHSVIFPHIIQCPLSSILFYFVFLHNKCGGVLAINVYCKEFSPDRKSQILELSNIQAFKLSKSITYSTLSSSTLLPDFQRGR